MKQELNLFFHPKEKKYYFVGSKLCECCKKQIENLIFIHTVLDSVISYQKFYCGVCATKIKHPRNLNYSECRLAIITDVPPKNAHPFWITAPILVNSNNLSVFEAADLRDCDITDKTRIAGRESWGGCQISSSQIVKELNHRFNEPMDLLIDNIKNSTPVLPGKEKTEQIEHKEGLLSE